MKIKLNLIKLKNALVFQILEQDLHWNNISCYTLPNGVTVRRDNSYSFVEHFSSHNTLYLRYRYREFENRRESDDYNATMLKFEDDLSRDRCYEKILDTIKYWSENQSN